MRTCLCLSAQIQLNFKNWFRIIGILEKTWTLSKSLIDCIYLTPSREIRSFGYTIHRTIGGSADYLKQIQNPVDFEIFLSKLRIEINTPIYFYREIVESEFEYISENRYVLDPIDLTSTDLTTSISSEREDFLRLGLIESEIKIGFTFSRFKN